MLELIDIHTSYDGTPVLKGVSCAFGEGKVVGLIGDNGAGKTTLLRTATTILAPQRGEIRFLGAPLHHDDLTRRSRIGALIEQPGHYDELTVTENLEFFYSFHASAGDQLQRAVQTSLSRFGLTSVANQRLGRLSTGFRQRVAVARAFHPSARVVLLDEPLSGLDPTTRNQLKGSIREIAAGGLTIVISSHGLADLDSLCDELYVLARGIVRRFNDFSEIRNRVNADPSMDLDAVYTKLISLLEVKPT